jgi:4-amino-4-deoxy-L-arabinose transferase-like glycosyltransferase
LLFRRKINQSQQRDLIILLILSLIFRIAMAAWASQPWYFDAAYYFDVAKNLARGHGFTEDFIFMYLTPAKNVVHPSNFYWMPLTSIIIAPFLTLFGMSWHIAQIPILLLSIPLPLFTYWIGWDIFQSRRYALAMALFMLIGGYTYPLFIATTDSLALYGWVSSLALVGMYQGWRGHPWRFVLTGIAIGLAHLTRADGILLLPVACLIWLCSQQKTRDGNLAWQSSQHTQLSPIPWQALLGMLCCYLLTMAPWFLRNIALVGSPLPTGGMTTIWFTNYADFFSFHKTISPQTYLSWGWKNILSSKVETLINHFLFLNEVTYIPFIFVMIGMWIERKRAELFPFLVYLIFMYGTLSLVFTIPSTHGTFFHSLVPLLPFLYAWAITGIDRTFASIRGHKYALKIGSMLLSFRVKGLVKLLNTAAHNASLLFLSIAMVIAIFVVGKTALIVSARTSDSMLYQEVGKIVANDYRVHRLLHNSVQPIVMVADPPDYYYATGQHAVLWPTQNLSTVLDTAQTYSVSYILFTPNYGKEGQRIWQTSLTDSRLQLIWSSSSGKLYRFSSPPKIR